jgi:hypothetical protein
MWPEGSREALQIVSRNASQTMSPKMLREFSRASFASLLLALAVLTDGPPAAAATPDKTKPVVSPHAHRGDAVRRRQSPAPALPHRPEYGFLKHVPPNAIRMPGYISSRASASSVSPAICRRAPARTGIATSNRTARPRFVTILTRGGRNPRVPGIADPCSTVGIPTLNRHPTTGSESLFGGGSQREHASMAAPFCEKSSAPRMVSPHRGLFVTATAQSAQNPGRIGAAMP